MYIYIYIYVYTTIINATVYINLLFDQSTYGELTLKPWALG